MGNVSRGFRIVSVVLSEYFRGFQWRSTSVPQVFKEFQGVPDYSWGLQECSRGFWGFFGRPKGVPGVPRAFQSISQMSQGIAGGFRVTSWAFQECLKDFRSLSRFKGIAWVL